MTRDQLISVLSNFPENSEVYICLPGVDYCSVDEVVDGTMGEPGDIPFPLLVSAEIDDIVTEMAGI